MFSSNSSQVSSAANYIEDVFSTYLYTGNGSTQTITNNIDLSTYGGLVWVKGRNYAIDHALFDTNRGASNFLFSDSTSAAATYSSYGVTAFNSNGFNVGDTAGGGYGVNGNSASNTYVSWTFRKQPKFFDVVTWTGTDGNPRNISHSLGSVPGCIIFKKTSDLSGWYVYHNQLNGGSSPQNWYVRLDLTSAQTNTTVMNGTLPTSTQFSVSGFLNNSTETWVAYIFADNAGGFGLTGTDNVITCGSFTVSGYADTPVTLGYEPQFVLYKCVGNIEDWVIQDNMRGMSVANGAVQLYPDSSAAEVNKASTGIVPTATGFIAKNYFSNNQYIYIAIRRGPMAVPTTGTSVYNGIATTGTGTNSRVITGYGFPPDLLLFGPRSQGGYDRRIFDRLRNTLLYTDTTSSEASIGPYGISTINQSQDGYTQGTSDSGGYNQSGTTWINWGFRRAPSVFDVVCYTGTGTTPQNVYHNLGVVPELIMFKSRSTAGNWQVFSQMTVSGLNRSYLNFNNAASAYLWTDGIGLSSQPTSTLMAMDNSSASIHTSGVTYVAYLFATCAGVSKVGSYTGNGSTQAIACGFTGGARFVLIKRTDDVGDWYVYDTARGMSTLTDPYILLDSTSAETATLGSVTTTTGGFTVNASILSAINTSGGTYIFLAIA